ncbi:hypothetical protein H7J08_12715 [Mycobacterium frederiksbergense]|uniref:hypothetical protein n=1 Tax=Mycolicibacterium frederiksbergense TaxID=117567 RepID=UPI0021F2F482|nr:hypothetical protein [Mycolicibacterium frederiksbergense]MCV7045527.1 hypothetical protein [Mycolicibacterium frederiksbergense]
MGAGRGAPGIEDIPGIGDIEGMSMGCSIILLLPMFMEAQQLGRAIKKYRPTAMTKNPTAIPVIAKAW